MDVQEFLGGQVVIYELVVKRNQLPNGSTY